MGRRQGLFQLRQFLVGVTVQHGQNGGGGDDAVVIAMAQITGHEEVARLFKARQRTDFCGLALDIGVAGLPIDGGRTIGLQDLVGLVQAGRFHIDHKGRVRIDGRQVTRQHQADLVGEDFLARIIHHAAAVAVAVETEREVGTGFFYLGRHLHQHGVVFGVRIIFGEGPVEIGIHLDDFHTHTA